ncbi:hypothetical protein CC2G_010002 [Coprinopsis cinerea AmutBmut pab1-1]|nr:hypothetical protein CC2G_010002 [Coprinopsis cinerea AmutBmut pab1-1]
MLYYERAVPPRPGIYPSQSGTRVSEETLRPEMKTVELNGSVGSLVSEVGVGVMASPRSTPASVASSPSSSWVKGKEREILGGRGSSIGLASSLSTSWVEPRVIRSVAAGRGRSTSTQPSSSVGSLPLSSSLPSESTLKSHPNGNATHSEESNEPATPSLIAPAAKIPKTPLDSKTNGTHLPDQTEEEKPAVAPSTPKKSKPGPKLHSPKPVHPPASAPVVDSLES